MPRRPMGHWSRREFLGGLTAAGTAGLLGLHARPAAAEPPPETTKLRIIQVPGICFAPQFVAEDLLHGEGFTDVQYVKVPGGLAGAKALAAGDGHFNIQTSGLLSTRIDAGDPIIFLAGIHVGCFELFANDRVRAIRDLKGKTVAVTDLWSGRHLVLAIMLQLVGLDPRKDVQFITHPAAEAMGLFTDGKIDAFLGFPPEPQELRARKIGHVVVNTLMDRPWSQYFCCMAAANKDFVRQHPVAAKRVLRALLKATDVCTAEPERVARLLVAKGYARHYDYAHQTMKELRYDRWRDYDPEDTVRFYALRLHEAGMIKSSPQKIIAQGTDWRFINELKKELKG